MIPIYLSHFLDELTPGFAGKKEFLAEKRSQISEGHSSNSLNIKMSNHVGTHMDLPFHFDQFGAKLDNFPASYWHFKNIACLQLDATSGEILHLEKWADHLSQNCELLLIKTNFEKKRSDAAYWDANPGISPESADFLKKKYPNIRCIGFDFISLTSYRHRELGRVAHAAFLGSANGAAICIIEDMKLSNWSLKIREVTVAPLLIDGADGVPVTVFGWSEA